jgi:catechol 2,3-dioxygenase-like lactoylglutathione lyase family enzyme
VAKFHHLAVRVSDIRASERFYVSVLGGTVITLIEEDADSSGRASLVKFGDGTYLELFPEGVGAAPPGAAPLGPIHFAYGVDDVDAAYARAIECGATDLISPQTIELPLYPGRGIRNAFVLDLNGDVCEFVNPDWVDRLLSA